MTQFTDNSVIFSIPSKVILFGEYAVLKGAPAIVAALSPRFEFETKSDRKDFGSKAPDSPVGRLKIWAEDHALSFPDGDFKDPFRGAGGFGGSTAEFALAYMALAQANPGRLGARWDNVWGLYRELTRSSTGQSPSGADLCAQWRGGTVVVNPVEVTLESLNFWSENPKQPSRGVLIFSTTHLPGMKTATHTHLDALRLDSMSELVSASETAVRAFESNDWPWIGSCMNEYGDLLNARGLEVSPMTELRSKMRSIAGVLGVKGAGAMQSDAMVVVMDCENPEWERAKAEVMAVAKTADLRLIQKGLFPVEGITQVVLAPFEASYLPEPAY